MKISKEKLKQIIKEELKQVSNEFELNNKDPKLDESLVDVLSNPATMAALAGALGVGVLALKGLLQNDGQASDRALQNVRTSINKRVAQSQIPPEDLGAEAELAASPRKRAERDLLRLKALRGGEAALNEGLFGDRSAKDRSPEMEFQGKTKFKVQVDSLYKMVVINTIRDGQAMIYAEDIDPLIAALQAIKSHAGTGEE